MASLRKIFSGLGTKTSDSNRVMGIDIGSSSIKVVEVQERDGVLTLTTYGELQLGPYADTEIGQSVIIDPKKEQQALVDVIRESAVKATSAVFAMPLASSFVTTIHFTADQKEDISSRVRVEARKYIPVPIGEVTLDWAEIETEIECFSAIRGVFKEEEQDIALIDIGAVSTKLYIARQGLLQRMHRVRAGGAIATKRIASTLDLSFEDAELLKRSITKDDAKFSDVKRAHHSCYDRAWQEFRQVINEYEQTLGTEIETVYLTGGGSLFPATKNMIEDILQKKVVYVNAFNKVAYPAFMEDMMRELGPTFHVALGRALCVFE